MWYLVSVVTAIGVVIVAIVLFIIKICGPANPQTLKGDERKFDKSWYV